MATFAGITATRWNQVNDAVTDLIDALHDELSYEVNQSAHVLEHVRAVEALLDDGKRYPTEGWW